jgi:hypothetical protein
LLHITERSGKLRKDQKQDIIETVSTLRNIFMNIMNTGEEQNKEINRLGSELAKAKEEIKMSMVANQRGTTVPPMRGRGTTSEGCMQDQLPPGGGARKTYLEALQNSKDKRFKILVKAKINLPTESIKTVVKTNINPTAMKVGVKSVKSLKDGRVLIETGTSEEAKLLSDSIRDKCGNDLEVFVPKLRNPRIVIYNVPQDIKVENLEEIILAQNPELGLGQGDIMAKFSYRTKQGRVNMVIEVCSGTRKKLLQAKLKLGWLICNTDDYLVARRCFRCSRFNHGHQQCKNEESCPLCTGQHKLKECTVTAAQYKCVNCMLYNSYTKGEKISVCHSSLDKNCPSLQAVLAKYILNTDY